MAGPWEQFQTQAPAPAAGPWTQFQQTPGSVDLRRPPVVDDVTWFRQTYGRDPISADQAGTNDPASFRRTFGFDPVGPQAPSGALGEDPYAIRAQLDPEGHAAYQASNLSQLPQENTGNWNADNLIPISGLAQFLRSVRHGATLGFDDDIYNAAGGNGALLNQLLEGYRVASPMGAAAGEMLGAAATSAVPGGWALRGGTTAAQAARGAAVGAGISGLQAAGEATGTPEERARAALIPALVGGVTGGLFGVASGPSRAASTLMRTADQTGPEMAAAMARNPNLMALDVDPNALGLAQGLAVQPGSARSIVSRAINDRQAGRTDRVTGIFDAGMGQTPNALTLLDGLKRTAQTNAQRGFGQALVGAAPVDLSSTIAGIDAILFGGGPRLRNWRPNTLVQAELSAIRDRLTQGGTGLIMNPQTLHQVQSDLRRQVEKFSRSASGGEQFAAGPINDVRQNIVAAIDEAAGAPPGGIGPYRAAQRQYFDDKQVQDAFDTGATILQNPRAGDAAMEARPEFWRDWVSTLSGEALEAARLGARTAIDNAINMARNAARTGEAIPEVGFNRERLRILFGQQEADRVAALLADERTMAGNATMLLGNSQTAVRSRMADAVSVRRATGGAGLTGLAGLGAGYAASQGQLIPAAGLAGLGVLNTGYRFLGRMSDQARNRELARLLTAQGPAGQAAMSGLGAQNIPTAALISALLGAGSSQIPWRQQ
jgi:hypothetical protein